MDDSIEDIVEEEPEEERRKNLSVDEADSDAPVIKLVHSIVAQAVQQGASDIHVNPEEGDTRVLFRVDGVLAPAATVKRAWPWASSRASRSWPTSTSPRSACRRTGASR